MTNMPTEAGRLAGEDPAVLFAGKNLSDFNGAVRHDAPVDEFLDFLVTSPDVIRTTVNKNQFDGDAEGPELRYWMFYVLAKDRGSELPDLGPPQRYPMPRVVTEDSIIPEYTPRIYTAPTPIHVEFPIAGVGASQNSGRLGADCRETVRLDMAEQWKSSRAVQELMKVVGSQVIRLASFDMAPLLAGVEYRFQQNPAGRPERLSSRLFYTHHFLKSSGFVAKVLKRWQATPSVVIPDWIPAETDPYNNQHTAKKMALSLIANQMRHGVPLGPPPVKR